MKKSKVIIISLLGMLLFVPFMTSARAQTTAANVSLTEGDYIVWQQSMDYTILPAWEADNMTATFDEVYNHTGDGSDPAIISGIFSDWSGLPWTRPLFDLPVNVTSIGPVNATTGEQVVNVTLGYRHPYGEVLWPSSYTTVNNTADLAENWFNGSMLTTPNWVGYVMDLLVVSPDVNWTEMAEICDAGMKWGLLDGGFNYNLTVTALANGMSILMPANEFGNNSRDITLSIMYDSEGLLAHYFFMYGSDMLIEIWLEETDDPAITVAPIDATVANDYTGESLSWTATDANPDLYTIWVNMTEVASDVAWTSGTPVVYNIPDGLASGVHTYRINFEDYQGNSASDTVLFTVEAPPDTTDPVLTATPTDIVDEVGYTGQSISWTATDANPYVYAILENGTVVVLPTAWTSGTEVTYNIPDGYLVSVTTYEITFSDIEGNNVTDSATFTVEEPAEGEEPPPPIPGFEPLIIIGTGAIATLGLIFIIKKRK